MDAVTKANNRLKKHICDGLSFSAKEAYKKLRANILLALDNRHITVGLTSPRPGEGKSTTAINLAYVCAETEKKVLLVDLDLRLPTIHAKLDMELQPGVSNLLRDVNSISSVIQKYTSESGVSFDIISAGDIPPNPSELIASTRMKNLIDALKKVYDIIILDLPPVDAVVDAVEASRFADGMIIAVRENNCPRFLVSECIDALQHAKANILGFVMTGSMQNVTGKYKYNNYYDHKYGD